MNKGVTSLSAAPLDLVVIFLYMFLVSVMSGALLLLAAFNLSDPDQPLHLQHCVWKVKG